MHNSAQLRCSENGNDDFGVEAFWIGDAARVGYFVPLNGPLNGHLPSLYIIREEASIFAPQRIPFYKDPRVAACTVGKVRSSTVFMCVCRTFRPSDFLLFVKNGFVVGVRCQGNREPPADSATTPLSQRHSWLGSP